MNNAARRAESQRCGYDLAGLAQLFHALSDETRLRIVEQLLGGEKCVCELTDKLDAAQSRLSFHLKTLKDAGLVADRREGRWVYYSLVPEALAHLGAFCASSCERARESGVCCV
jgi:ArsR family transcriptional regulator